MYLNNISQCFLHEILPLKFHVCKVLWVLFKIIKTMEANEVNFNQITQFRTSKIVKQILVKKFIIRKNMHLYVIYSLNFIAFLNRFERTSHNKWAMKVMRNFKLHIFKGKITIGYHYSSLLTLNSSWTSSWVNILKFNHYI